MMKDDHLVAASVKRFLVRPWASACIEGGGEGREGGVAFASNDEGRANPVPMGHTRCM